jgi:hypothetical protein
MPDTGYTQYHVFEQAFKNIDDALWKEAGCTTELDYTEQTSWLLFLKYLDALEQDRADEAALEGKPTCADSPKSWTVDARTIDPATFDLSVKNPNGGEAVVHRSPAEIMDEIAALDAESAAVLETSRGLL